MARGDAKAACPKFEESYRLDPQVGTLLNAALCHETIGRSATASAEFTQVVKLARAAGDAARVKFAQAHAAEAAQRIAHLRLRIARPDPDLTVRVAGRVVPTS